MTEAVVEHPDGTVEWVKDGVRHRDDGPAVIRPDGSQEWWQDGNLHRLRGPAIICADGSEVWYREGVPVEKPCTVFVRSAFDEAAAFPDYGGRVYSGSSDCFGGRKRNSG